MNKEDFNKYLDDRLSEPDGDMFNPEGNSAKAVVKRMRKGCWYAFKYECKEVRRDLIYFYTKDFDGLNTPIVWFINAVIYPPLLPLIPIIRTYTRYRRAIKDYKDSYELQLKKQR